MESVQLAADEHEGETHILVVLSKNLKLRTVFRQ